MSRSFRHMPITGITKSESEKEDKRAANRAFRRISKQNLEEAPESLKEVCNVYEFAKDGKQYLSTETQLKYPELLRK